MPHMNLADTQIDFSAYNAVNNAVLVLNKEGRVLFANKAIHHVLPEDNALVTIFDLLQDQRLSEGLREHIQQSGKTEYVFSGLIKGVVYYFNVTEWQSYYVCNGQSETEIEALYQKQISSRKKMLDIKAKLLWLSMMDKEDFDFAVENILKVACDILTCERVSYWEVSPAADKICCQKLYLRSAKALAEKTEIQEVTKQQVPAYFECIAKEYAFILAEDIEAHPATAGFTEHYSKPLNIKSLLDVPVWHNGKLHGIICAEQVGVKKHWHLEDVQFLLSISDNVSMCLQTRERLQAELKLKELNLKLRRSNTDLEHFASVAAHDMKSPLRSIVSYLQLIKRQHADTLGSAGVGYLDYTMQNATHLTQLINDLLSYSKLEQQVGDAVPVDINDMIQRICTEQDAYNKERNGTIIVADKLPVLKINNNMLYRLFANIMHNAIKYSTNNIPPVLEIGYKQDDNFHYFEFADNGIGIDDQYAEKIFSLFGRLHSLNEFDGTGIGLATCKKIAELFGGKILYKRRANPEGSIFTVLIPIEYTA